MKVGDVWNETCHLKSSFHTSKNVCEASRLLDKFSVLMSVIGDNWRVLSFCRTNPFVRVIKVISV